jgi:hypothetical protein
MTPLKGSHCSFPINIYLKTVKTRQVPLKNAEMFGLIFLDESHKKDGSLLVL